MKLAAILPPKPKIEFMVKERVKSYGKKRG